MSKKNDQYPGVKNSTIINIKILDKIRLYRQLNHMESVAWSISVRMRWRAARSRGSEQQQRRRAAYVVKELKTFTDKIYAKYLPYNYNYRDHW